MRGTLMRNHRLLVNPHSLLNLTLVRSTQAACHSVPRTRLPAILPPLLPPLPLRPPHTRCLRIRSPDAAPRSPLTSRRPHLPLVRCTHRTTPLHPLLPHPPTSLPQWGTPQCSLATPSHPNSSRILIPITPHSRASTHTARVHVVQPRSPVLPFLLRQGGRDLPMRAANLMICRHHTVSSTTHRGETNTAHSDWAQNIDLCTLYLTPALHHS